MKTLNYDGSHEDLLEQGARAHSPLVFDTETSGLHPDDGSRVSVVSLAWLNEEDDLVYVAYPFGQGGHPKSEEPVADAGEEVWEAVMAALERWPAGLVGHNVKFDLTQVEAGSVGGYAGARRVVREQVRVDTMVGAKELWPTESAALKPTAARLWGEDEKAEQEALKPWLGPRTNARYDLVPWSVMKPYAEQDAVLTLRLLLELLQAREEGELLGWWVERETRLSGVLHSMEQAGVPFDAERSLEVAAVLEERRAKLEAALPFERKAAKKFYFSREPDWLERGGLGLEPYSLTAKTGQPQLTAEVLEQMVKDEVPWAKELGQAAKIDTALKMWYKPYAERTAPDGRIRTVFRQVASGAGGVGGTASGRYSVERLNLQAIPHDYRLGPALEGVESPRALVARGAREFEGWTLFELDLKQAELRVAALWAGCTSMLEAIHAGEDVHGQTARELFESEPGDERWGFYRQVAKRANFSLIFGSGAKTFKAYIEKETGESWSLARAKRLVWDWNDLYPEYGRAIDTYMRLADTRGRVELAGGRYRWFRRGEDTHKAFNQRVQGSLAEYAKDWLLSTSALLWEEGVAERFEREYPGRGGGGLLMVIHDSQVLLLPNDRAEDLLARVVANSESIWDEFFPGVPGGAEEHPWEG